MSIKSIIINNFNNGVSNDKRNTKDGIFQIASHFNIFKNPKKLIPNRSNEDISGLEGLYKPHNFKTFVYTTTGRLYFIGYKSSSSQVPKMFYTDDLTSTNLTEVTNEGNGNLWVDSCCEYKGFIYGFQGTNQVFKIQISNGTITNSVITTGATITSIAKGVIAKDDVMYMAYNNIIVSVDSSGVTDAVLTLPSNMVITSLTTYGNYLAIACNESNYKKSYVFLWDLISADITERIDWGDGNIKILENLNGYLVGVTDQFLASSISLENKAISISIWGGGSVQRVIELNPKYRDGSGVIYGFKAIKNNKLYFLAKLQKSLTTYDEGVWEFGLNNGVWALNLAYTEQNADSDGLQAFGMAQDFVYINHSQDGSISRTYNQTSFVYYTFTSTYESQIFDCGDPTTQKKLKGFSVSCESLPTSGQIIASFKKIQDSSWTTMFTLTTDNATYYEHIINEAGNIFSEIQFKLESIGGAEITGFKFIYEELINKLG